MRHCRGGPPRCACRPGTRSWARHWRPRTRRGPRSPSSRSAASGARSARSGRFTPNPAYEEVCSGRTGHSEAVRVVFDPAKVTYRDLLKVFWESHDPTQGMRQGNDVGTQYRSAIFYHSDEQRAAAEESLVAFQKKLSEARYGEITTQIEPAPEFYFAEDYHQQYLSSNKNPNGYCGLGGTGVSCPVGVARADG